MQSADASSDFATWEPMPPWRQNINRNNNNCFQIGYANYKQRTMKNKKVERAVAVDGGEPLLRCATSSSQYIFLVLFAHKTNSSNQLPSSSDVIILCTSAIPPQLTHTIFRINTTNIHISIWRCNFYCWCESATEFRWGFFIYRLRVATVKCGGSIFECNARIRIYYELIVLQCLAYSLLDAAVLLSSLLPQLKLASLPHRHHPYIQFPKDLIKRL